MLIKVLAAETTLTSATNVSTATVVRVINTSTAAVVTRKDSTGATIGSFTMAANEVAYVEKEPTDTLEGGAAFKAVKVAYSI
jgi:hypothetical protein